MRHPLLFAPFVLAVAAHAATAQQAVTLTVDLSADTFLISPYIYGAHGFANESEEHVGARRMGGNRLTGYNWENNNSHAGNDYFHQNDNYLVYTLPDSLQRVPGIAGTRFHDNSRAAGAYSAITLNAAGYVARDRSGPVQPGETAPSARWCEVRFRKGAPLSLDPDTSDAYVYMDEWVNFLVNRYGRADAGGVNAYIFDNEPALWPSTHPRIHPAKPTVAELIGKSIALAGVVKEIDPTAEFIGPAAYGYSEYLNLQDAPDWSNYSGTYATYLDAYLAKMKSASDSVGYRLLDVLDVHWYPEAQGTTLSGGLERIALSNNNDPGVAEARMQAPRSLWDSSYTEQSWIGQYFSPIALLPWLRSKVERNYPGTKLAVTEFNYGGESHISGGVALADVLGIFGREGLYLATYWGELKDYIAAAYRIYRNYDGNGSAFGHIGVRSRSNNDALASVYSSIDSIGRLHIIAINKGQGASLDATIAVQGGGRYRGSGVYQFDAAGTAIHSASSVDTVAGSFTYTLPPTSVTHFVLVPVTTSSVVAGVMVGEAALSVEPNVVGEKGDVYLRLPRRTALRLAVVDSYGREAAALFDGVLESGPHHLSINLSGFSAGLYTLRLASGSGTLSTQFVVVR